MSLAATAYQQSTATASQPSSAAAGSPALNALTGNFTNFLSMLMTQLKNQDPTSPMDTNQFTTELVQFASVEQQIKTNTSLTQLIQLTQAGEIMQSAAMIGRTVQVESDHLSLQGGRAAGQLTASASGPVQIAITSESGLKVRDVTVNAVKGVNTWAWDGRDGSGRQLPDGSYRIAITQGGGNGAPVAVPFTISGTATGVVSHSNGVQLQIGALSVPFSAVKAVAN